jgi:hypothetical protein
MIGIYLRELYSAFIDLLPDLNEKISDISTDAVKLNQIVKIAGKEKVFSNKPYIKINTDGEITGKTICQSADEVVEEVPIVFELYTEGTEEQVLTYESILKSFLKENINTIREKVTDAYVVGVNFINSRKELDATSTNSKSWKISVKEKYIISW